MDLLFERKVRVCSEVLGGCGTCITGGKCLELRFVRDQQTSVTLR